MVWALPDADRRVRVLPVFFTAVTRLLMFANETYTTEQTDGVAAWYPPDPPPETEAQRNEAGMPDLPGAFGREDYERLRAGIDILDSLHERDMQDPHWFLGLLGVEPDRQGQGLGSKLIAPILARADADHLPCYLETEDERNVGFYRRHGFDVVVEGDLPEGGPRFWTMRREPRE
ncbi:MAG: GNAT family N-acetyltransferase [Dehalococcoidia bacterium]